MKTLFKEIRHNPLLWLLVFVPTVFAAAKLRPEAHTLLLVLSVLPSVVFSDLHIMPYVLAMLFSLKANRELFASVEHGGHGEAPWPVGLALATLAGVTVLVAWVCQVFVESVLELAKTLGMTPAFVGFT